MGRLTEQDKAFIREHPNMMNKELAELLHHDRHTIGRYKEKIGIAFSQTHNFSQYNNYIISNYNKTTSKKLAEEIGCSKPYIIKVWREAGLHGKTNRSYYCDYNFFHIINSENKAYLLGFIASDGNLYKRENHEGQVQINLNSKDKEILEKILIVLNSNHPIKNGKTKTTDTATITFISDVMYNDLINIGLTPNKTWNLQLQKILDNIPKQFWKDFIRGYFDGDGHITGNNTPSSYHIGFSLPENIKDCFLKLINTVIHEDFLFILDKRENHYSQPFGTIFSKNITQQYLLLKIMYYNNPTLFLQRKYEKAIEFFNLVENNVTNRSENKSAVVKWGELLENLK